MFLHTAIYVLSAAVLLGLFLSLHYLGVLERRSGLLGLVHGGLGAAGVAILFASLGGAARGAEYGVQSFGTIAAAIATAALLIALAFAGLQIFAKRRVTWLIGAHATVALTAYFFLLAYVVF